MSATQLSFSWSSAGLSQNNFLWCLSFWNMCLFTFGYRRSLSVPVSHSSSERCLPKTSNCFSHCKSGWGLEHKIQPSGSFGSLRSLMEKNQVNSIGHFNPSEAHIAFMFWTKICNLKSKRCFSEYLVHAAFKSAALCSDDLCCGLSSWLELELLLKVPYEDFAPWTRQLLTAEQTVFREARSSSITSCPVESCKITLVTKHLKMVNLMMLEETTRCLCVGEKRTFFASVPLQRVQAKAAHSEVWHQPLNTTWNELVRVLACSWGAAARSLSLVLMFELPGCAVLCAVVVLFPVLKWGRRAPAG